MNPVTHALISWGVANVPKNTTRRQRLLVTGSGLLPDVDGLGAVPDLVTRLTTDSPTRYFHEYHHDLHGLGFALLGVALAAAAAGPGRRLLTSALVFLTFHLHLLCDWVGARGPATPVNPAGDQWPMPYFQPFSDAMIPSVEWQWQLNAWPNFLITGVFLTLMFVLAKRRGYSIVEIVSRRADRAFVNTLRARFGGEPLPPLEPSSSDGPQSAE